MSKTIVFDDPIEPIIPIAELPGNYLITNYGRQLESKFQVYFLESTYKDILKHVETTPDIESGGILIGHHFKTFEGEIQFVVVSGAIAQHSENRSRVHFTVGPKEDQAARKVLEEKYDGLTVVGWYHSHPNHGIFLSGQDMDIVRGWYNLPWHIALVIDPIRRIEGIFVGPKGKPWGFEVNNGNEGTPLGSSWSGLKKSPDSIQAISIYNRLQNAQQIQDYPLSNMLKQELFKLISESSQLIEWHNEQRFQDITWEELSGSKVVDGPLSEWPSNAIQDTDRGNPSFRLQPAREKKKNSINEQVEVVGFALTLVVTTISAGVFFYFAIVNSLALLGIQLLSLSVMLGVLIPVILVIVGKKRFLSRYHFPQTVSLSLLAMANLLIALLISLLS